jgi:hypothetical protein
VSRYAREERERRRQRKLRREKMLLLTDQSDKSNKNVDGVVINKNDDGSIKEVIWPEPRKKVYLPASVAKIIYRKWHKRLHSLKPCPYVFAMMESLANSVLQDSEYKFLELVCSSKYYTEGQTIGFMLRDNLTKQKTEY